MADGDGIGDGSRSVGLANYYYGISLSYLGVYGQMIYRRASEEDLQGKTVTGGYILTLTWKYLQ